MTKQTKSHDIDPKRATFKTQYPLLSSRVEIKSKKEFEKLKGKSNRLVGLTIHFNYVIANNGNCIFSKCQFFIEKGNPNCIKQITFKSCTFDHCFLGSVEYLNVRFENCSFKNCDFSNSRFEFCVFDQCNFEKCSAYHPEFINTEIHPNFIKSLVLLLENYQKGITSDIKDSFYAMKYTVAKKVYNSNNSIDSHTLSDLSLYELKKAEHMYLKRKFCNALLKWNFSTAISIGKYLPFKWLNIKLTNGGTSLYKLVCYSIIFILFINYFIYKYNITEANFKIIESQNSIIKYFDCLPRTASIFLAYGYTAFAPKDFIEYYLINIVVIIGLFFYALLISVLMRKIYK